jgi:hypothetical protein
MVLLMVLLIFVRRGAYSGVKTSYFGSYIAKVATKLEPQREVDYE